METITHFLTIHRSAGFSRRKAENIWKNPPSRLRKAAIRAIVSLRTREWRNGRRPGFRFRCRKAWGFKSPCPHHVTADDISIAATFFKSHLSLILSRLLSKSQPLHWVAVWYPLAEAISSVSPLIPNRISRTFVRLLSWLFCVLCRWFGAQIPVFPTAGRGVGVTV